MKYLKWLLILLWVFGLGYSLGYEAGQFKQLHCNISNMDKIYDSIKAHYNWDGKKWIAK